MIKKVQKPVYETVDQVIEVPQVQYVDKVVEVPMVQKVQKTVEVPQIQTVQKFVDVPVVKTVEQIIEVPRVEYQDLPGEDTIEQVEQQPVCQVLPGTIRQEVVDGPDLEPTYQAAPTPMPVQQPVMAMPAPTTSY